MKIRSKQLACSICETRKEKRFCPAVHGRICPQCCGEQREVTLDCPSDCVYLQQARQHEKQQEHLLLGLSYALAKSAGADHGIRDSDLIAALTALARRYQMLASSGLHYESPMTNVSHQAIAVEIEKMVKEYRDAQQKHMGYVRVRDNDVLRALVFLLRMGYTRTSGRPRSRAFVDFLLAQFPEQSSAIAAPQEASRIIVP
ncbi:MAG: hypothetical protein DMG94_11610 [Acidobacteria bacterium]|nr:MAG: hypothetical protein DMG94_11610 [Acidobacteriota bacterium]